MMDAQIIDLFSGIGGFSVAGHSLGWETVLFCEKESFPQQALREQFPRVPIFDDVCKLTKENINGLIQPNRPIILTGGFPCQPFSVAGAREGTEDSRHLWPEMYRIIREIRPDYIIGENVPGLLSIEGGVVFEQVCNDLESEGYEVQAFVLPACATGAPHRRDRIWIVAYSNNTGRSSGFRSVSGQNGEVPERYENAKSCNTNAGVSYYPKHNGHCSKQGKVSKKNRLQGINRQEICSWESHRAGINNDAGITSDNHEERLEGRSKTGNTKRIREKSHQQPKRLSNNYWHDWSSISPFHTGYDGIPPDLVRHIRTSLAEVGQTPEQIEAYLRKESNWLRKEAIKCAGNAIVPQVVLEIMKAIESHYNQINIPCKTT